MNIYFTVSRNERGRERERERERERKRGSMNYGSKDSGVKFILMESEKTKLLK